MPAPPIRTVVLVLGVCLALAGWPAAPAHGQAVGDVLDVRPLPGSVIDADGAALRALVATDAAVSDVTVTAGAQEVPAATREVATGVEVTATLPALAPGVRSLRVVADTADGPIRRTWSVTATARAHTRLSGPDRAATAVAVSRDQFPQPGSTDAVVLARADDFADALAGAPLATHLGGPLLLTDTDALSAATRDELDRVLADAGTVHVLGGRAAVSDAVVDDLEAAGHRVVRHAGATRYETAVTIARELPAVGTVMVASGRRFPDALAASAPAARAGWPILLTEQDRLPDETRAGLGSLGSGRAVVVGGQVAVSTAVVDQLEDRVDDVVRVAGATRYDTAAAIADRFFDDVDAVALASGTTFPDALGAAVRAAALDAPLLLTAPTALSPETDRALRTLRPRQLAVHGGTVAIGRDVAAAAVHAVVDGPGAPRVVETVPASGATSSTLSPITVRTDRALAAGSLVASVTLDDVELPTTVRLADDGRRVVVDPLTPGDLPTDQPREVRVVLRGADADGRLVHHTHRFVLRDDRTVFATWRGLELVTPSPATELIGYHQSNHEGARELTPTAQSPTWRTLASRGRRTSPRSAADVVADEHVALVAPVTGTVLRAGSYVLYCDQTDNFLAIRPDGMPGVEVKLLHFRGLQVRRGDRVVAGETIVGSGPRRLPFSSQVDRYSSTGYGPHVHVEVVDTSIANVPNSGSGSEGC